MDASGQSQQFTARRLAAPSECEPFAFLQASETGRILTMKPLVIAGRAFHSRLIVGTGKYKDGAETQAAIEASGAEMVTVAVRRCIFVFATQVVPHFISTSAYLPVANHPGCFTALNAASPVGIVS